MLRTQGIKTFYRQVFSGFVQVAITVIISKTLGYKGLGVFAISTLAPILFAQLFSFGIGSSSAFHIASGRSSQKTSINATILFSLLVGPFAAVTCAFFFFLFHSQLYPEISYLILLVSCIACPALLFIELILGVLQGANRLDDFNLITLIQPSSFFIGIIALWSANSLDELTLVIAWVLSWILPSAYSLYVVSRAFSFTLNFGQLSKSYQYIKTVFPYAIRAHCSNIVTFLIYRLDVYLVGYLAGNSTAGIYFLAVRLTEQFWIFSHAASTVLLPRLTASYTYNGNSTNITPRAVRTVTIATFVSASFFCIGLWGFSFLTDINSFSILMSNIIALSFGAVAFAASRLLANDNASRGFVSLNIISALVILIVNTSLDFLLIPILGSLGASFATLFAYICSLLLQLGFQKYFFEVPLAYYLPKKSDVNALKEIICIGISAPSNIR